MTAPHNSDPSYYKGHLLSNGTPPHGSSVLYRIGPNLVRFSPWRSSSEYDWIDVSEYTVLTETSLSSFDHSWTKELMFYDYHSGIHYVAHKTVEDRVECMLRFPDLFDKQK